MPAELLLRPAAGAGAAAATAACGPLLALVRSLRRGGAKRGEVLAGGRALG